MFSTINIIFLVLNIIVAACIFSNPHRDIRKTLKELRNIIHKRDNTIVLYKKKYTLLKILLESRRSKIINLKKELLKLKGGEDAK